MESKKKMFKKILVLLAAMFMFACSVEAVDSAEAEQIAATEQASLGGLQINEVKLNGAKWFEVLNTGASSVNLTGFKLVAGRSDTGVDMSTACTLSGTLAAGSYLVKTSTDCSAIPWTDPDYNSTTFVDGPVRRTYSILDASNVQQELVTMPQRGGWPATGMSYSACPNGSDTFCSAFPTQGSAN